MITKSKNRENSLHLKGLPALVNENVLKCALLSEIGQKEDSAGVVNRVSVARQKVPPTTDDDLKCLEEQIATILKAELTKSTVQVTVRKPKTDQTAFFQAEAFFSDPVEGLAACKNLKGRMVLNQQAVEIKPLLQASMTARAHVMEMCSTQYQTAVQELADTGVQVISKQQKNGSYLISIQATDLEDIVNARARLTDMLKGDVLDVNNTPDLHHLFTPSGRKLLRDCEKDAGALVSVDSRFRTVSIHGSDTARATVRTTIADYLARLLQSGSEEVEVILKGGDNPPGLLKALITAHGDSLEGLRDAFDLLDVTVDYRRHKVRLAGNADALQMAKADIQARKDDLLAANKGETPEEEEIECTACLCPVELSDLYRLEICAHPYCKDCIKRQVIVAITDRKLPIVCSYEDCDVPLAWRDLSYLSRAGHVNLRDLTNAAIAAYILANREKARFCGTPDCPMVYRVTPEDNAAVFQCPQCDVRTCTTCHAQSHDGMTCAMLRETKKRDAEKEAVEAWASQDQKNRRPCPGCQLPIEKDGGCNRMTCSACGISFCWPCGEKFATPGECYNHLSKMHDGYF